MTSVREVLLARSQDSRPALLSGERVWSWAAYVEQAARRAHALRALLDPGLPPHVGLLMDNTPEMAFALAAAGLGDLVAVGLNTTRRGQALAADVVKADCQVVLADPRLRALLEPPSGVRVVGTDDATWTEAVEAAPGSVPDATPGPDSLLMLIFTSGTSGEPKAVRITHEKVTRPGAYLAERLGLGADDVCYVSMPLFHSNSVMAGWGPALMAGATIALAERFSASRLLDDVRRYGATYLNYVGKPLSYVMATPERHDDAENPLRIAFGNEAGDRDIEGFARRFGCTVIDGFGSTENAVVVSRVPGTPPGSLGVPLEGVAVLDPATREECPRARFDQAGRVTNLDEATGELVNTTGAGQFAGYYRDEGATAARMRDGMYWSGDLAYRDEAGFVYYAGRTDDWLRVDGENLAAAPIERTLVRHPSIAEAAVYAVPDVSAGDQLVAALVLVGPLTPGGLGDFLDAQADLGTKSRPRYVRVLDRLPRTATNKVLKRELRAQCSTGATWEREERGTTYAVAPTRVTRHLAAPRPRVYAALVDASSVARWKVPTEMDAVVHAFDAREGGELRVSLTYRSPDREGKSSEHTDTYRGRFERLVPDELVVEVDEFETDDPSLQGPMTSTIRLRDQDGGTLLQAVHEGLPAGVDPVANEVGWREALDRLAVLVEEPHL